ncbi:THAP domain-containing protein 1-like [Macrosteles quadrilineatus]|uniref:THAP domain-containing protein 1-like n=1 Tax=Macrosteles quadrilineatus TaxID=74068 RepID=UPI0023E099FC|nr:THAP domain-containing protein 1-like [Macrosteles quadrilineatus]
MVVSCSAFNCTNRAQKGTGISFHKFPHHDPDLLKKWVLSMKRKKFTPSKYSRLCSKHFTQESYQLRPNASYPLLKEDAVPTVFDFPPHLKKSSPQESRIIKPGIAQQDISGTSADTSFSPPSPCSKSVQQESVKQTNTASLTILRLRHEVKIVKQRLKRRDEKIKSMKHVILTLKKKCKLIAPESLTQCHCVRPSLASSTEV